MMNLKKGHLEKYQELRYLSQQIARNEVEALIEPLRFRENLTWLAI